MFFYLCQQVAKVLKFSQNFQSEQTNNRDDKIDDFLSSTVALSLASIVSHNIFHQVCNTYFRPPFWVFLGGQSIRARIPWVKNNSTSILERVLPCCLPMYVAKNTLPYKYYNLCTKRVVHYCMMQIIQCSTFAFCGVITKDACLVWFVQ